MKVSILGAIDKVESFFLMISGKKVYFEIIESEQLASCWVYVLDADKSIVDLANGFFGVSVCEIIDEKYLTI